MRYVLCLATALALLAASCGGGDDEGLTSGGTRTSGGPQTPDRVVSQMFDALAKDSKKDVLATIEPDRRNDASLPASFGVVAKSIEAVLTDAKTKPKLEIVNLAMRPNYEDDKAYASVNVTGSVKAFGEELKISQDVLTAQIDGRWYVTTWDNAYWKDVRKLAAERDAQARDPVAAAFAAQANTDASLPGTYVKPHPGRDGRLCADRACASTMDDRNHLQAGLTVPFCTADQISRDALSEPLCYNSNPPTSGPHANTWAAFRVLPQPAPKEQLVHNMEHGGVVVWYNTNNTTVIGQLEGLVGAEVARGRFVVMSRYTEMEPETVAVTAWTRLEKMPVNGFNPEKVQNFINRHHKRFNPEGF